MERNELLIKRISCERELYETYNSTRDIVMDYFNGYRKDYYRINYCSSFIIAIEQHGCKPQAIEWHDH
jgi:hypothetical protein